MEQRGIKLDEPTGLDPITIDDGVVMRAPEVEEAAPEPTPVVASEPAPAQEPVATTVEPEPEPAESEEKDSDVEGPSPDYVTDIPSGNFAPDSRQTLANGTYRMPASIKAILRGATSHTLNAPLEMAMVRFSDEGRDPEQFGPRFEASMYYGWPMTDMHDRVSRKGSIWTNNVIVEGRPTGGRGVRPKGTAVTELFRSQNSLGQTTEWVNYNTGIIYHMRPALDSELVRLEYVMSQDRALVGQNTYGNLLSADMGAHLGHLMDFCIGLITWTNLEYEGDMHVALRQHLRGREALDVLLNAQLASLYPHGYPWAVHCHAAECGSHEDIDVFFARAQHTDLSMLKDVHLNILHRNSKQLSHDTMIKYMEALDNSTRTFTYEETTYHFRLPSIADFAYSYRRWNTVIEKENAEALANFDSEKARDEYIDAQTSSRALMAYSHYIGQIDLPAKTGVIEVTDRAEIENILQAGSADLELVSALTEALAEFELDSRTTFIGYENRTCPTCGARIVTSDGPWSSIVPLPVSRIFFTHMQQKILLLRGLRERL